MAFRFPRLLPLLASCALGAVLVAPVFAAPLPPPPVPEAPGPPADWTEGAGFYIWHEGKHMHLRIGAAGGVGELMAIITTSGRFANVATVPPHLPPPQRVNVESTGQFMVVSGEPNGSAFGVDFDLEDTSQLILTLQPVDDPNAAQCTCRLSFWDQGRAQRPETLPGLVIFEPSKGDPNMDHVLRVVLD